MSPTSRLGCEWLSTTWLCEWHWWPPCRHITAISTDLVHTQLVATCRPIGDVIKGFVTRNASSFCIKDAWILREMFCDLHHNSGVVKIYMRASKTRTFSSQLAASWFVNFCLPFVSVPVTPSQCWQSGGLCGGTTKVLSGKALSRII